MVVDDQPVNMFVVDFADAGMIALPKNDQVDVIVVGLGGTIVVAEPEVLGQRAPLATLGVWKAAVVPGAFVDVRAAGAGRALVVVTTAGNTLEDAATRGAAWKTRPAPVGLADLSLPPDLVWQDGAMRARIAFEGPKASFGLLFVGPHQGVPEHTHPDAWEILLALAGGKEMKVASAPGAPLEPGEPLEAGQGRAIPKAALHAGAPLRDSAYAGETFVGFQMYVPAGPEQRFKALSRDAAKTSGSGASAR